MVKRVPGWLIVLLLPAAQCLSSGGSPRGDGGGDGGGGEEIDSLVEVSGEAASAEWCVLEDDGTLPDHSSSCSFPLKRLRLP